VYNVYNLGSVLLAVTFRNVACLCWLVTVRTSCLAVCCCPHCRSGLRQRCRRVATYYLHVIWRWFAVDRNKFRLRTHHLPTTSGRCAQGARPSNCFIPCPVGSRSVSLRCTV